MNGSQIWHIITEIFWLLCSLYFILLLGFLVIAALSLILEFVSDIFDGIPRKRKKTSCLQVILSVILTAILVIITMNIMQKRGISLFDVVNMYIPIDGSLSIQSLIQGSVDSPSEVFFYTMGLNLFPPLVLAVVKIVYRFLGIPIDPSFRFSNLKITRNFISQITSLIHSACILIIVVIYQKTFIVGCIEFYDKLMSAFSSKWVSLLSEVLTNFGMGCMFALSLMTTVENSLFVTIFGYSVSQLFIHPSFTETGKWIYIGSIFLVSAVLEKIYDRTVNDGDDNLDLFVRYTSDCYFFAVAVPVCAIIGFIVLRYLQI